MNSITFFSLFLSKKENFYRHKNILHKEVARARNSLHSQLQEVNEILAISVFIIRTLLYLDVHLGHIDLVDFL